MVLDILKTHKHAMLDIDHILAKLKAAGEIMEPKDGFFRAM